MISRKFLIISVVDAFMFGVTGFLIYLDDEVNVTNFFKKPIYIFSIVIIFSIMIYAILQYRLDNKNL